MAIFIEQGPDEVKSSFNLQRRAEIVSIYLTGASIESQPALRKYGPKLTISVGHKSSAEVPANGVLLTHTDFALSASPEDDEKTKVFSIRCSFEITYELEKDYKPTPEEIEAFSNANAVFNAWPYFREFVQNGCVRSGLPGEPAVPFLKLIPKLPEQPRSKNDTASTPLETRMKGKPRKIRRPN